VKKNLSLVLLVLFVATCSRSPTVNPPTSNEPISRSTATPAAPNVASTPKGDRGTPDEAKAMLEKAVEHYNSAGQDAALADFTAKKAPFYDRDLYVACVGPGDIIVANGGFPNLVGSSTNSWKDADGHPLGKATRDALSRGEDSIKYRWYNPTTGKIEPKIFFIKKVGNDICGVGAYNP
jgi:cytochrome c